MILILLACTDSKNFRPDQSLHIGAYRSQGFDRCIDAWRQALGAAPKVCRAGQMYKGGYWFSATKARVNAAIPSKTLVVSAGLGLVDVCDMVPAYAATFTPSLVDSIPNAGQGDASERWWAGLGGAKRFEQEVRSIQSPRIISALPERYLDAARSALVQFSKDYGSDRLVVLGSRSHKHRFAELEDSWLHLDARMIKNSEIGGTAGQLTANALRWILDQIQDPSEINPEYLQSLIKPLQDLDDEPLYPKRQRCSEDEVRRWIRSAWRTACPPISKTEALRRFRADGLAFEQKRFGRVYQQMIDEEKSRA